MIVSILLFCLGILLGITIGRRSVDREAKIEALAKAWAETIPLPTLPRPILTHCSTCHCLVPDPEFHRAEGHIVD